MKKLIYLIAIFFISTAFTFISSQEATEEEDNVLHIVGVGDIMLGTNYPNTSYLPPNKGTGLMQAANHILSDADLTFGNLEGTVLNSGGNVKRCSDPSKCYAFRMPENLMDNLITGGFDVMSIANNHSGDFGPSGRTNTIRVLKNMGIKCAGLLTHPSVVFEKNGITYGFAAFAPNSGTVDIRNISKAKTIVAALEKEADVVIVSFHGGAEGAKHQHVTKRTETYYGENRGNVHAFSHAVIDAGADIVFGHGPHVTRAVEVYKDRFIAYSLGNFCTYGRFSLKGVKGFAPIINVKTSKSGYFISAKVTSIAQVGRGVVTIDKQNRALNLIRELTNADFPNSGLAIDSSGDIYRR